MFKEKFELLGLSRVGRRPKLIRYIFFFVTVVSLVWLLVSDGKAVPAMENEWEDWNSLKDIFALYVCFVARFK